MVTDTDADAEVLMTVSDIEDVKALIIDGVEFPVKCGGYNFSRNKIWSKNTGRTESGDMVGTIIAIKNKIEIELIPISPEQADILDEKISDADNPFRKVKYLALNGTQKEMDAYFGDVTYPWLSSRINGGIINGVKISIIQQ